MARSQYAPKLGSFDDDGCDATGIQTSRLVTQLMTAEGGLGLSVNRTFANLL